MIGQVTPHLRVVQGSITAWVSSYRAKWRPTPPLLHRSLSIPARNAASVSAGREHTMGILAVDLFITLDGVYQAPGGPDEDPSGGFAYGGWQAPYFDNESGAMIGAGIDRLDALLLGRTTYDIFAGYWPHQGDNPIAAKFNAVPKFVASRTLTDTS